MKHRKLVVVSILVMLGIASGVAGLTLYTNYAAKASAPSLPDVLNYLPSDSQVVFGIDVQKFVTSPAYEKFRQKQTPQIGNDLASFIDKTGVDPARDVSYLVGAGRSKVKAKGEGVVIVIGKFNKEVITSYIRSKTTPVEMEYEGTPVLMIPEPKSDKVEKGIAFLNEREIALGDLESLKAVLDVRIKGNKGIWSNPSMATLIRSIGWDEMFWFAGDATGILAEAPVTTPLGTNFSAVQNITGTLNFADMVTGKITLTAIDEESATKMTDFIKGLIAFGQLSGNQNPDMKRLFSGLKILQDSKQIGMTLNFPVDLLDKFEPARILPRQPAGN